MRSETQLWVEPMHRRFTTDDQQCSKGSPVLSPGHGRKVWLHPKGESNNCLRKSVKKNNTNKADDHSPVFKRPSKSRGKVGTVHLNFIINSSRFQLNMSFSIVKKSKFIVKLHWVIWEKKSERHEKLSEVQRDNI